MCGILGYSGKKNYNFNKIQTLALCNSYERGGDATGFYTPSTGIIKDVYKAHDFINKGLSDKLKPDNLIIGHLRKSSVGVNNVNNAHPFENDGVVVCHNGTLVSYIKLATLYDIDHKSYSTDSQVLAQAIAKDLKSHEDDNGDILNIFYNYEGAAAVLFYDNDTNTMYAYRDDTRPLYYGMTSGGIYISSLMYSLEIIGCKNVKEFNANALYTIKEGKIIKIQSKIVNNYYSLGKKSDFEYFYGIGYKQKLNTAYTGINSDHTLLNYLIGFRIRYKDYTSRPKDNLNSKINEYTASLTKDSRYEVTDIFGAYIQILDDNDQYKKVYFTSFDLTNVFPVVDRYCTVHNKIINENKEVVAEKGDIIKVISYIFKQDTFKGTVLKTGETFSIRTKSFLPFTDKEHDDVVLKIGEKKPVNTSLTVIEEIEEDDVPFNDENNSCEADGANWVHFNQIEILMDILIDKIETAMDNHSRDTDIKHNLDDIYDLLVDCYNKSKFENLINKEIK